MVYNDPPFTGLINDPLQMEQWSSISAPFYIKFDSDAANVHRFKNNMKIRKQQMYSAMDSKYALERIPTQSI
jgi:hypothetical protein